MSRGLGKVQRMLVERAQLGPFDFHRWGKEKFGDHWQYFYSEYKEKALRLAVKRGALSAIKHEKAFSKSGDARGPHGGILVFIPGTPMSDVLSVVR